MRENTTRDKSPSGERTTSFARVLAIAIPILPGKKANWQEMANRFKTRPMKAALNASRKAAAVHECTFLQETPQGDLVIVTLDGGDPWLRLAR